MDRTVQQQAPLPAAGFRPRIHHVGVQTADLENCLAWYGEFFGAERRWELDRFSELTLSRLPGIRRLAEVAAGDLRFHLFDRAGHTGRTPEEDGYQFQHVCLEVDDPAELADVRDRWHRLRDSGRFTFARPDGPTEVVVDDDGVSSLYLFDVNGLEYEFTHVPEGPR
ncbi:VOC family protein [Streptomyces zingiberis]|uniref:VOC family protein n=1 Tax=Streptomyces zingiberis TaxID=2053010 RepID=A0ABX1C1Q0_9ACTN|nr:VOC family protein [Streptomyces zingiberis]NJQ03824.1 VOC family protein [Streptomyces zingiberis]